MRQLMSRAKKHYVWSPKEFREFIIAGVFITLAFIIPRIFEREHSVSEWISSSLLYLIIALAVLYAIIAAMKLTGLSYGYVIEYRMSVVLLAIGIYLSFLLQPIMPTSITPWLFLGTFRARTNAHMRLGVWRPFRNQGDLARIVVAGILAALILLFVFKGLWYASGSEIIRDFVVLSWMIVLGMLIPVPGSTGLEIFKNSIFLWFFVLAFVVSYGAVSLLRQQGAFFISFALAAVATWLFSKYAANH